MRRLERTSNERCVLQKSQSSLRETAANEINVSNRPTLQWRNKIENNRVTSQIMARLTERTTDSGYQQLLDRIFEVYPTGQTRANQVMYAKFTETYWQVGLDHDIAKFEQGTKSGPTLAGSCPRPVATT